MVFLFHVVEEKTKSVSFCKRKEIFKEEKVSKSFDKDRADVLAASDRGSYFEQEKLISQDEEEQSRWENETVSASRQRQRRTCRTGLTRVMAKVGWSNNCCRQSRARKSREISYPDSRISLIMSCLALSPFEVVTS